MEKKMVKKKDRLRDILETLIFTERDVHYRLMAKGALTLDKAEAEIMELFKVREENISYLIGQEMSRYDGFQMIGIQEARDNIAKAITNHINKENKQGC